MRVFLDTNVIVCTCDSAEIERHPIAVRVIDCLLAESDEVVISPQVVGEFVNTMKQRGTPPATLTLQIRGLGVMHGAQHCLVRRDHCRDIACVADATYSRRQFAFG